MKSTLNITVLIAGLLLAFSSSSFSQAGTLDSSFGVNGKVTTDFGAPEGTYGYDCALQSDGKVVVVGYINQYSTTSDFAVARYNANGNLDSTFGINGKVTTHFEQGVSASNANFAMSAAGNKNDLLFRVKRMLNKQEKSYSYRNQVFALLLITIMLTTVAWLNPATRKYSSILNKTSETTHKVMVEPLTASADNPLFNPMYFFSKPAQEELDKAIDEANTKVNEAAPVIEETASNILTSVTPIALEKLQNLHVDLNDALAETKEALKNIDIAKLQTANAPALAFDSATLVNAAKNVLLNTLNNTTEWKEVGADIQKAQEEIFKLTKDNNWSNGVSAQVSDAIKSTADQLAKVKIDNNFTLIFQNALDAIKDNVKQKIDIEKAEDAERKMAEKIKERSKRKIQLQREQNQIAPPAPPKEMKTYSDIQDENTFAYPNTNLQGNYNVQVNVPENIYTPVNFNDNYAYNYTDSISTLNSAIIVVKHNPCNDSSHTKHITVEITSNNGLHKCYEFTVEVCQ